MTAKKSFFRNIVVSALSLLLIIPTTVCAYSDSVYLGGENIGIEINTNGIMVVGMYKVGDNYPGKIANLKVGDIITKVNDKKVNNIAEMVNLLESTIDKQKVNVTYLRNNKENLTNLRLEKQSSGVYKTGLYVKDKVTGIGTLTFIDPANNKFGALGHEIIEANSGVKLEVKDGIIYRSIITSIKKSERGIPGEKNAKYDKDTVYGNIMENTSSGIFGKYTGDYSNKNLIKVGNEQDVKLGNAYIKTVLKSELVEDYEINIIKLDFSNTHKNILFEVIDPKLSNDAGGVVAGMSGSPIIQNDMIIGAVSHVIVDSPNKGYGIFVTTMLKESES